MTCLSFGKKVLGFVALPFTIIFAGVSIIRIFSIKHIQGLFSFVDFTSFAIVVILGSIATMMDEKNRLHQARSENLHPRLNLVISP